MSEIARIDPARQRAVLCAAIDAMYQYCVQHPAALQTEGVWRLQGSQAFTNQQVAKLQEQLKIPAWQPNFDFATDVDAYAKDKISAEPKFRAESIHAIVAVVKKIMLGSYLTEKNPQPVVLFSSDDGNIKKIREKIINILKGSPTARAKLETALQELKAAHPIEYKAMAQLLYMHNQLIVNTATTKMNADNLSTSTLSSFTSLCLIDLPVVVAQDKKDGHAIQKSDFVKRQAQAVKAITVIKDLFAEPPKELDYSVGAQYAGAQVAGVAASARAPAGVPAHAAVMQQLAGALELRQRQAAELRAQQLAAASKKREAGTGAAPAVPSMPAGLAPPPAGSASARQPQLPPKPPRPAPPRSA